MTVFSITANCDQIMTVTLKKYKENKNIKNHWKRREVRI